MRIILVRHGDAVNSSGKFHGWIDNPITSKGLNEASNISGEIKQYHPSKIISSPMQRARASAHVISQKLGIPMEINNALKPLNLGDYDGKPIEPNLDKVRQHFVNTNKDFPNGESTNDWAQRFIPFLNNYLYKPGNETVAMLTHGRNILLAKADRAMGNNLKFDKNMLLDSKQSTEHGGYAVITPDSFDIKTPKSVHAGQS